MMEKAMRKLNENEIELVSGGYEDEIIVNGQRVTSGMNSITSSGYTSTQVVVSGYSYTDGTTPIDLEQFTNQEIVVVGEKMTDEQKMAYDYHYSVATNTVNAGLLSILASMAYYGLSGWAGVGGTVGAFTLDELRQKLIDNAAATNYRRDGADGVYDGHIDPRYGPAGDLSLP